VGLLLTACTLFEDEPDSRACPSIFKMREAARTVQFRDGVGRDLTDVAVEGGIGNVQLVCRYEENELTIAIGIEVLAQRGPASQSNEVRLPIFVAVLDQSRRVIAKEVFDSILAFNEGSRRTAKLEEYETHIRLQDRLAGESYQFVVGFQLTADQLQDIRGNK